MSEFVLSNELVSMALAMVAENPEVNTILSELFTPDGNELYVHPASRYLRLEPAAIGSRTLLSKPGIWDGRVHRWEFLLLCMAPTVVVERSVGHPLIQRKHRRPTPLCSAGKAR